jgi:hypothetical protein
LFDGLLREQPFGDEVVTSTTQQDDTIRIV